MKTNEKALRRYVKRLLTEDDNVAKALREEQSNDAAFTAVDLAWRSEETFSLAEEIVADYFGGKSTNLPTSASQFVDVVVGRGEVFISVKSTIKGSAGSAISGSPLRKKGMSYIQSKFVEPIAKAAKYTVSLVSIHKLEAPERYKVQLWTYPGISYDKMEKLNIAHQNPIKNLGALTQAFGGEPEKLSVILKKPQDYQPLEVSSSYIDKIDAQDKLRSIYRAIIKNDKKKADRLYASLFSQ